VSLIKLKDQKQNDKKITRHFFNL